MTYVTLAEATYIVRDRKSSFNCATKEDMHEAIRSYVRNYSTYEVLEKQSDGTWKKVYY